MGFYYELLHQLFEMAQSAIMELNMKRIKVLYVAAEITPYASAGGLGEVGRSFPKALAERDEFEVRRVMPLHRVAKGTMKYHTDFPVEMDQEYETCVVKTDTAKKEMVTYFIGNDRYFYRDQIYGYEDDGLRFFFFCKAIVELLKHSNYKPDIVHTNDWHTGFLALLLKKEFPKIRTVYTVHNIFYHGFVPAQYLKSCLSMQEQKHLGWPEWLNFMKAGLIYSDLLTTVSQGYCEELRQPELGCGMTPYILGHETGMIGIPNGIDMSEYNPMAEGELEYPFDGNQIENKKKNRSWLKKHYGLPVDERPLVAMITRLDYSKGTQLLRTAISFFDFKKFQLILMGTGSPYEQGLFANLATCYPEGLAVDFTYSPEMAKRIYAGADIYLMPSQFEPCGLGQLYAMRYGAVPVVNPVGGLRDTVTEESTHSDQATGFYMEEWSGQALNKALNRALNVYGTPRWKELVRNCMSYDSSWQRSVEIYEVYYKALVKNTETR